MRFIDTMILGAGHSVILPHKPESTQIDQLAEYVVARDIKKSDIESFGLFGGSNDFNRFYPDLKAEDLVPKDGDYIEPVFRMLTNCIVAKNSNPTEFPADILKASMKLLIGQTVYPNHDDEVGNEIGSVKSVFWEDAKVQDGVTIPAGINAVLRIDAKSNPKIARGILMDPPSVHSNSVTVVFSWKPSHNFDNIYEFYDKMGTIHADGTLIRRIATGIEAYLETSLVPHGADPFAQLIKNGKLNNAIHANRRYQGIQRNSEKNEIDINEIKDRVSYIDFKNWSKLPVEEAILSLSEDDSKHNTTGIINETLNNQNKNNMKLIELLTPLILALGCQVESLSMKEEDPESITQGIQKLVEKINLNKTSLTELEGNYNSLKDLQKPEIANFIEVGKQHLSSVRSATEESYKKLVGSGTIDSNIVALINNESTGLATLVSLKESYDNQLEKLFPLKCQDCHSTKVSRVSSVEEGGEKPVISSNSDIIEGIVNQKF